MKLDKELPVPLYHQLMKIMQDKIVSKEWPPGYKLPTEVELEKLLDVSRITIKRAIMELVKAGLLYRQQGKGTFVSHEREERELFKIMSLANAKETLKETHPHKLIEFSIEEAGMTIADKLDMVPEELVIKIYRLKMEGEKPIGIEHTYLPCHLFPNFNPEMIENELIYGVLRNRYGIQLDRAKLYLSLPAASSSEASILNVEEGAPLILWERSTYAKTDQLVEYSEFIIRQDKAKYLLEISLSETN